MNRISLTTRLILRLYWYTTICYFLQQTMDEMGDILEERPRGRHAAAVLLLFIFATRCYA